MESDKSTWMPFTGQWARAGLARWSQANCPSASSSRLRNQDQSFSKRWGAGLGQRGSIMGIRGLGTKEKSGRWRKCRRSCIWNWRSWRTRYTDRLYLGLTLMASCLRESRGSTISVNLTHFSQLSVKLQCFRRRGHPIAIRKRHNLARSNRGNIKGLPWRKESCR